MQKTGVSFRRKKQFALVQIPSSKRVQLGLNLEETPSDPRVSEVSGMCTHRVNITDATQIDDTLIEWLNVSYQRAG